MKAFQYDYVRSLQKKNLPKKGKDKVVGEWFDKVLGVRD
jgi:hypothetical protein